VTADDDVTLGEVNRNVTALRQDIKDLTKDVTDLKVGYGKNSDKTARLETIIYGTGGLATAALITAVFSLITREGS
jgi:hypothetical protein